MAWGADVLPWTPESGTVGPNSFSVITTPTATAVSGKIGTTTALKATLKVGTVAVAGKTVSFKIDDVAVGSGKTDAKGSASIAYVINVDAGPHTIKAEFAGDGGYYPSSGT